MEKARIYLVQKRQQVLLLMAQAVLLLRLKRSHMNQKARFFYKVTPLYADQPAQQ